MKFLITLVLLIISSPVFADDSKVINSGEVSECPKKLKNMCVMVSGRMKDKTGQNKYLYKTKFLEASCIDSVKDTLQVQQLKMQNTWLHNEKDLLCSNGTFDVNKGNVLKFAIAVQFDEFIYDITKWKVGLNTIDETDDRTALDYVEFHVKRNSGNAMEEKFQNYYDRLRSAGAKHKHELHN